MSNNSNRVWSIKKGRMLLMDQWTNVEVEKDGKTYAGKYRVDGGIITVAYHADGGGDKATQVGNSDPQHLAELLLIEIVTELRNEKSRP
jgi:hypothetical protein